jgi:hypothetical protein
MRLLELMLSLQKYCRITLGRALDVLASSRSYIAMRRVVWAVVMLRMSSECF